MKKSILSLLAGICLTFNMFAADETTEFKLRDIATPSVWRLTLQIPFICIKDSIKNGNINAIRALWFLLKNRHIKSWHGDNHLHHDNKIVHGPDSIHEYAATKYPDLQPLLPEIFDAFTKSMTINKEKLGQFLDAKEKNKAILTYGDDIDVVLRLKDSLANQGWSDEHINNFLNELTIKVYNSNDVIAYFEDYLTKNADSLSPEFKTMLDKKINPAKYVPAGYTWNFK